MTFHDYSNHSFRFINEKKHAGACWVIRHEHLLKIGQSVRAAEIRIVPVEDQPGGESQRLCDDCEIDAFDTATEGENKVLVQESRCSAQARSRWDGTSASPAVRLFCLALARTEFRLFD